MKCVYEIFFSTSWDESIDDIESKQYQIGLKLCRSLQDPGICPTKPDS